MGSDNATGDKPRPWKRWLVLSCVALVILPVGAFLLRWPLSRLLPINYSGKVMRIARFHKGGFSSAREGTRQLAQFAIIFEDGFQCEGSDTSLAAVEQGDHIQIRAYHDVKGWPIFDPEWWECDEGQLVSIAAPENTE